MIRSCDGNVLVEVYFLDKIEELYTLFSGSLKGLSSRY